MDLLYVEGRSPPALPAPLAYRLHGYAQTRILGLGALRLSRGLRQGLADLAPPADVVHGHGIWLWPNLAAAAAARRAGKPFVCSPRGMLSREALAFSPVRKRLVWTLGQRAALAGAAALHATSDAERGDIRAAGLTAPVAVIPNGVDTAEEPPARPAGGVRTALSLGRIHPKKGLDTLLAAWARVEGDHPGWRLRIVGPAEDGHDDELRTIARSLGLQRVTIEGPVWGAEKAALYGSSELFVASTRNENFGLTVAEALAAAMPAISTTGAPWSELQSERCGWWVDQGPDALARALSDALARPAAELAAMGRRGRALVARRYGWGRVGEDMAALYRWIVTAGERPPFVHVD